MQGFGGESEGKRPLGRIRCRWKYNIKNWNGRVESGTDC